MTPSPSPTMMSPGVDGDAGAGDRGVDLPRHVPPPEHGRVRRAVVDRQVHGVQRLAVPDRAVGDDARRAADLGAQREDVADRARGRVAARLDDQDLAGPYLLDGALLRVQAAAAQRPAVLRRTGPRGTARSAASWRSPTIFLPGWVACSRSRVTELKPRLRSWDDRVAVLTLATRAQQVGGRVGGPGGAAGAVGGLALRVVGVRHRARRRSVVVGLLDRRAQPPGGQPGPGSPLVPSSIGAVRSGAPGAPVPRPRPRRGRPAGPPSTRSGCR